MSATTTHEAPLGVLEAADRAVDGAVDERLSLSPDRRAATCLADLGRSLLTATVSAPAAASFARGLAGIAEAIADSFDNIFWDLDYLAAVLLAQDTASAIDAMAAQVIALQKGFGRDTVIRFRYAHDFLYGFDWARWVAREPGARAHVGPFDPVFLAYLDRRRGELVELIAADDRKYHELPDETTHRNPFAFSREPHAERRLHEALAADDLIPVHAWDLGGTREWNRRHTELRREYADRLELDP